MSQITSANTLDLKSVKPNTSSKKKLRDDGFRKELDEKKKSSDRDQLSAAHHNSIEKRDVERKSADDSKKALRSKANETKAKNINEKAPAGSRSATIADRHDKTTQDAGVDSAITDESAPAIPAAVSDAQGNVAQSTEQTQKSSAAAATVTADFAAQLESMVPMLEAQANGKAGLSLEGMTLVAPEAVQMPGLGAAVTDAPATTLTQEVSATMGAIAGLEGKSLESESKGSESSLGDLKSDNLQDALNSAAQTHGKKDAQFESILKSATANTVVGADSTREANVENLVQSARTLLRNGGGEMQIILNPEGLGAVDLKVAVSGGDVNIEILAQDQNVKKMFEDGMQDIRGALELQNLKIDTFKVDVGQRSESNHFADQQTQQENANREFARDFMNQFRGERQGMRQHAMGYDMERSPNFSKSPEGLSPAQNVAANGRLNIVA